MFKAFAAFFSSMVTLFVAVDKMAKAADHIASIAEGEAQTLADTMQAEREARLKELKAKLQSVPQSEAA